VALSLLEPRPLPTIKSRRVRLPLQTRYRTRVAPLTTMIQRKRYHYLSSPSRMTAIPIAKRKSRSRHRRNGEAPLHSRKTIRAKKAQKHDRQCLPMRYDFRFLISFPILPFDIMLVSPILFLYYRRVVSTHPSYSLVFPRRCRDT
jgi:hypothetical protein